MKYSGLYIDLPGFYKKITSKSFVRNITTLILVAAGIIIPFVFVKYCGFRYDDEPYMALCCHNYSIQPIAPLTFFIGKIWIDIFGDTLLALRCLMALCYITAMAVGGWFCYKKTADKILSAAVFAIGSAVCVMCCQPVYGWDCAAYPFLALAIYHTLFLFHKPTVRRCIAAGVSIGLLAVVRIPDIAALGITTLSLFFSPYFKREGKYEWSKTTFAMLSILWLSVLATIYVLLCVVFGGLADYLSILNGNYFISGHSAYEMFGITERFRFLAQLMFKMFLPMTLAILGATYLNGCKKQNIFFLAALLFAILYSVKAAAYDYLYDVFPAWSMPGFITPLGIAAIFWGPLAYWNGTAKSPKYATCLILLSMTLLTAFGSDSAPERLGWIIGAVFAIGAYSDIYATQKRLVGWILLLSAFLFGSALRVKYRVCEGHYPATISSQYISVTDGLKVSQYDVDCMASMDSALTILTATRQLGLKDFPYQCFLPRTLYATGERELPTNNFSYCREDLHRLFNLKGGLDSCDIIISSHYYWDENMWLKDMQRDYEPFQKLAGDKIELLVRKDKKHLLPPSPFRDKD